MGRSLFSAAQTSSDFTLRHPTSECLRRETILYILCSYVYAWHGFVLHNTHSMASYSYVRTRKKWVQNRIAAENPQSTREAESWRRPVTRGVSLLSVSVARGTGVNDS